MDEKFQCKFATFSPEELPPNWWHFELPRGGRLELWRLEGKELHGPNTRFIILQFRVLNLPFIRWKHLSY